MDSHKLYSRSQGPWAYRLDPPQPCDPPFSHHSSLAMSFRGQCALLKGNAKVSCWQKEDQYFFTQWSVLLTSPVNLHVLLKAAFLVEASPADLAAIRFLTSMNPFVPLEVPGALKIFTAVGADEALLKHQPLHRPPPHGVVRVTILTVAQQPAAERALREPAGAAAGRSQSAVQRRLRET